MFEMNIFRYIILLENSVSFGLELDYATYKFFPCTCTLPG